MKQKTAMMELIEWLDLNGMNPNVGITDIKAKAQELIKKEKDQMESSFHIGIIISNTGQKLTYNDYYKRNHLEY
jgi:hypothetical protein